MATPRRRCSRCKRLLPLHYFNRLTRSKSGYREACRECINPTQRKGQPRQSLPYAYWIGTPEGLIPAYLCGQCHLVLPATLFLTDPRGYKRRSMICRPCLATNRRLSNSTNREHVREVVKAWHAANPEKRQVYNKKAYDIAMADVDKKAKMYAATAAWYARNPEAMHTKNALRDARHRNAPIRDLTRAEWEEIKAEHNYCCAYCGKHMHNLTMDHVIPLSKGGSHTKSNIVPSCKSCNSRKGNRT